MTLLEGGSTVTQDGLSDENVTTRRAPWSFQSDGMGATTNRSNGIKLLVWQLGELKNAGESAGRETISEKGKGPERLFTTFFTFATCY